MSEYLSDLTIVLQLPKPLEEYSKEDQLNLAKMKMRAFIDESDFNSHAPRNAQVVQTEKQRDAYCRRIYQNTSMTSDFDYLYRDVDKKVKDKNGIIKTLTLKQPARVRHIPIVSPKLRALISREKLRPLKLRAFAIDKENIDNKINAKTNEIINKYSIKSRQKLNAYNLQQEALMYQAQLIQQQMQNPELQSNLELQNMIKLVEQELESINFILQQNIEISQKELDAINKFYKYNYKDFQEQISEKILNNYVVNNNLKGLFNKAFEEKLITDKPIYYVDFVQGMKQPVTELVRPEYLDYQYSENTDNISDVGWAVRLTYLTFEEIIIKYGAHLSDKNIESIKAEMPRQNARSTSNLDRLPDGQFVGLDDRHHHAAHNELYPVYQCYWKEYVAVPALVTKNKNPNKYLSSKPDFIEFKTVDEMKQLTNTKAKRNRLKKKGVKAAVRYRVDLWEGIKIGEENWILVGKKENQPRDIKNPYDVKLPFIGKNIYRFNQSRSLVWECRDIQELFNILHYQEELLIALSGVKGVVYDLAQKPEGMSPQEINYYMRQGIMYIKTVKNNGKKVNSSFNQFQSFDQTISPAIQYINAMKANLINLVSMITGIYQNLEGQVANTDQVGTMQMSIQQSSASVEIYYQEMEDLNEKVLTRIANLYENQKDMDISGAYILNKLEQEVFNIPAGTLEGKFQVYINSGIKEKEAIDNAKRIALNKFQSGEMKGSEYLSILDMESLTEMRKFFAESEEKMMKIAEQTQNKAAEQQQRMIELQQEMEARTQQFDAELQTKLKQLELSVEERKNNIKQQEIEINQAIQQENLKIKEKEIDSERQIEEKYLEFQKKELAINAQNQKMQILIANMKSKIENLKSRSKEKIKD